MTERLAYYALYVMVLIHNFATHGNVDALRQELAKNVSPDLVCPNGFVPLHNVVAGAYGRGGNNEVACIHLLVAAGANVNARVGSVPGSPPPAGARPPRRRVRVPRRRLLNNN